MLKGENIACQFCHFNYGDKRFPITLKIIGLYLFFESTPAKAPCGIVNRVSFG